MTLFDAFSYRNKRAVVVGGATGMGAAVAELVRDAGAEVVVMDRAKVTLKGVRAIGIELADKGAIDKTLVECGGKVDGLFSCAGVADGTPGIERIDFIGHRYMIDRMFAADMSQGIVDRLHLLCCGIGWEANLPLLTEYLNIEDFDAAAAWAKDHGKADYMWSKQAICAYVARMALPFLKRGVRINATLPGPTDTPLARANADRWLGFGADYRKEANVAVSTSLEQAFPLVFLCSEAAAVISGITLITDVGFVSSAIAESFPSAKMTVNFLRGVGGAIGGVSVPQAEAGKAVSLSVKPETPMLIDGKLGPGERATFANVNPATEEKLGEVADGSHKDMSRAIAAASKPSTRRIGPRPRTPQALLDPAPEGAGSRARGAPRAAHPGGRLSPHDDPSSSARHATRQLASLPDPDDGHVRLGDRDARGQGQSGEPNARRIWKEAVGVVGAIRTLELSVRSHDRQARPGARDRQYGGAQARSRQRRGTRRSSVASSRRRPTSPGVVNIVTSWDPLLGEDLTLSADVDIFSFTGSTAVGQRIMEKGAATLKRTFLELGGKSANIFSTMPTSTAPSCRGSPCASTPGRDAESRRAWWCRAPATRRSPRSWWAS